VIHPFQSFFSRVEKAQFPMLSLSARPNSYLGTFLTFSSPNRRSFAPSTPLVFLPRLPRHMDFQCRSCSLACVPLGPPIFFSFFFLFACRHDVRSRSKQLPASRPSAPRFFLLPPRLISFFSLCGLVGRFFLHPPFFAFFVLSRY